MAFSGHYLGSPQRYELLHLLARGGMSEIYLAQDHQQGIRVVVKIIHLDITLPSKKLRSAYHAFQREVEVVTKLSHPFIVPLQDFGQEVLPNGSLAYIVMPYYPAGSLNNWLKRGHQTMIVLPCEVTHFVSQAAQALHYAHQKGVIHRDVKPANFLVTSRDDAPTVLLQQASSTLALPDLLLADFGIAKFAHVATTTASVIGSTPYMAPEHWKNHPVYASDQYALAVMAYELMTGELPFDGGGMEYQHASVTPPLPSQINPTLSSNIDQVILHALAKNHLERFPSILTFALELEQAVEQSSPTNRTVSVPSPRRSTPPHQTFSSSPPQKKISLFSQRASSPHTALVLFLLLVVVVGAIILFPRMMTSFSGQQAALKPILAGEPTPTNGLQTLHLGPLVLTDTLKDNSQGQQWEQDSDSFGGCRFENSAYDAFQHRVGNFTTCAAKGTDFSDFVYQAQITLIAGMSGGILFRGQDGPGQCYVFQVSRDSSYALILYVDNTRANARILAQGKSSTVRTGLNESNVLKVAALKNSFELFINGHTIGMIQDPTSQYHDGHIGIVADANNGAPVEVIAQQIDVWTL